MGWVCTKTGTPGEWKTSPEIFKLEKQLNTGYG